MQNTKTSAIEARHDRILLGSGATSANGQITESATCGSIPSHSLGVKPVGNIYLSEGPNARKWAGSFQALPDEVLMSLLETFDMPTLCSLASTCRFFYAFCRSDELWKQLFIKYVNFLSDARLGKTYDSEGIQNGSLKMTELTRRLVTL